MSDTVGGAGVTQGEPERGHRSPKIAFRPDVEGLRAVAILLVVLGHLNMPGFSSGFVGVQVFFVISGFLITSLLVAEYRRSRQDGSGGRISFGAFYSRRARRILPAALTVIAVTLIVAKLEWGPLRFAEVQVDALWATFFAANFRAIAGAPDSFAWWQFKSPLQNYWSLAVEEQFYVVWPALFALAASGFGLLRGRQGDGWLKRVLVAVAALSTASLIWCVIETADSPRVAAFSTLSRAWQLGLGAAVAVAWSLRREPGRTSSIVMSTAGAAAIVASLFRGPLALDSPVVHSLFPTIGAALLIAGGIRSGKATPVAAALSLAPVRFIGRISYSLYLWHWPIIVFAATMVPRSELTGAARGTVLFIFSVVVAWLSWLLIEQPFRRLGGRQSLPVATKAAMGGLAVAVVAVLVVLARPFPSGDPVTRSLPIAGEPSTSGWRAEVEAAAEAEEFTPAQVRALRAQGSLAPRSDCVDTDDLVKVAFCATRGTATSGLRWPSGANRKVLLVGDGFAAQWRATLIEVLPVGTEMLQATSPWCSPFSDRGAAAEDLARSCEAYRARLPQAASSLRPAVTVIGHRPDARPEEVADFVERMRSVGSKVLWLGSVPGAPRVSRCLPPGGSSAAPCNGPTSKLDLKLLETYGRAAAVSGATWLDLADVFCAAGTCPAVIGSFPVRSGWLGGVTRPALADAAPWLRQGLAQALGS